MYGYENVAVVVASVFIAELLRKGLQRIARSHILVDGKLDEIGHLRHAFRELQTSHCSLRNTKGIDRFRRDHNALVYVAGLFVLVRIVRSPVRVPYSTRRHGSPLRRVWYSYTLDRVDGQIFVVCHRVKHQFFQLQNVLLELRL